MNLLLAIVIGFLYATGTYLILRRSIVKLILGLALLGHGANLLIFTLGRANRNSADRLPPLIAPAETTLASGSADPVPQALILTAIVIGFALLAFLLMLIHATWRTSDTGDVSALSLSDRTE